MPLGNPFDRHVSLVIQKPRRTYPGLDAATRLSRWFERTVTRSAFMRKNGKDTTQVTLPKKLARCLSLKTPTVAIVKTMDAIELRSSERNEPLCSQKH